MPRTTLMFYLNAINGHNQLGKCIPRLSQQMRFSGRVFLSAPGRGDR